MANIGKLFALGLTASAAIAAGAIIAPHEGKELTVYVDPVGVLTSCYGHTGAELTLGQTFTEAECFEQLAVDVAKFDKAVRDMTAGTGISDQELAAYISLSYNVGLGNFRTSTLRRKLHAGDRVGACNELSRWVYAGGKKLNGLVTRREAERKLCLSGI
tara:strand:+ start:2328 stop:2804 length:477 start_codon:yes stop_codon:yes gene_type:complete